MACKTINETRVVFLFLLRRTVQQPGKRGGSRSIHHPISKIATALRPGQRNIQKPQILSKLLFFGTRLVSRELLRTEISPKTVFGRRVMKQHT